MSNSFKGIVLYTDGSARPNPGCTGWGVHGYCYDEIKNIKKNVVNKIHLVTKFGYIHQNELGQNLRAVIIEPIMYIDGFGSGSEAGSNNVAEIHALYYSLLKITDFEFEELQVFTDSEYLRKGVVEWRKSWLLNNFIKQDGTLVSNIDTWTKLFEQIDILEKRNISISIDWVKGHNDTYGNIVADRLATIGVLHTISKEPRTVFNINEAKDYWKVDVERHPFISFKRLYFNSQPEYNKPGQYFQADPGKDELVIGKKIPEASYAVVRMNEPDPIIELVKNRQFEVSDDINSIMMLRLDRLYDPEVYKYISNYGNKSLLLNNRNNIGLNFLDQKPITTEINPAVLSLKAIEALSFLEEMLERYIDVKTSRPNPHGRNIILHDITEFFYNEIPVKNKNTTTYKLKDELVNGIFDISIIINIMMDDEEKTITIPILFGADILSRNSLKKIENMNPVVTLLTWYESENCLRYSTVIEIEGGIGIWSNFYSDRIFL